MATAHMNAELPKPSFAKVAASIKPVEKITPSVTACPAVQNPNQPPTTGFGPSLQAVASHQQTAGSTLSSPGDDGNIVASMKDLTVGQGTPSLVVDGSNSAARRARAVASRASGSDESQKADSSSELGTKPPSLDGKSITSGTTFALDEKESLRPDDSASVKAAAEDDDSSIRGSFIAGSRMGSDLAARARGIQLGDMPERRIAQPVVGPHGVLTPQSVSSERPPNVQMPLRSAGGSSDALNFIYRQAPDEKLLEALAAPKDKYFLLRLEKDVIEFVQDSKEPYMDLPPSNSFFRMLTHKLADYYHMTHSYEAHIGSVRIFRTPFCRVPPSLATMVPQLPAAAVESSSSTPPPAVLPRKIMRRGQDEDGGVLSAGASKTTSETGSDGKDKQTSENQQKTREEREEKYRLARQRIFGSSEENPSENDGEFGVSRASSVSATNKSNTIKKGKQGKQRRDDSDTFDSRHQYTPYWGPQQQTWVPQSQAQYLPPNAGQFHNQVVQPYPGQAGPAYGPQPTSYPTPQTMPPNPAFPAYPATQYPPQPTAQRYPPQPGASPMTHYGSPVLPSAPPPPQQQQGWQPGFTPPAYQGRGSTSSALLTHNGIPYAFGQLPANANPHDPKSQHPIPGSYNRNHAFNPKTQSFVPGNNGMAPVQPLQPPFTAPGSHHSSPQIGSPHLAYGAYAGTAPPLYPGGYNMARQGSNASMTAYHTPPHVTPHIQHVPPPMPNMQVQHIAPPPQHLPPNQTSHAPNRPNMALGPNQNYNRHLPNYGNPATLPQKPGSGI